ncbi:MAG: glycosyltransferase [Actinomycetota bacterium]|nr:glycosyltransferase [Actinomycetota bacterium]
MRILVVEPGPAFSVKDVAVGWSRAFRELGHDVLDLNYGDRLDWYSQVAVNRDDEWTAALDGNAAVQMAAKGIEVACYEFWPDVVVIVSCFFVPAFTMEMLKRRGHKVVILHTECPYEDEGQVMRAAHADLNVLNDPISLDRFRGAGPPAVYMPHAYDPAIHYRRQPRSDWQSEFCFVGTGFPSRVEFLESVDWTGVDFALAGMWARTRPDSPLRKHLVHDIGHCLPNEDTVRLYSSTMASANLYRREAETFGLEKGWAVGPREIELAALGVYFLRESRPEGDELFPMLETFAGPGDFEEKLRWVLTHDDHRETAAAAAQAAVADHTFVNNAKRLLELLDL